MSVLLKSEDPRVFGLEDITLKLRSSVFPLRKCQAQAGIASRSVTVQPVWLLPLQALGLAVFPTVTTRETQPHVGAHSFNVSCLSALGKLGFQHGHLFIQQTAECLLCARHVAGCCEGDRDTPERTPSSGAYPQVRCDRGIGTWPVGGVQERGGGVIPDLEGCHQRA